MTELTPDQLRDAYDAQSVQGQRLIGCMQEQLGELLESARIALGMPIEHRLKSLDSISEKIVRKELHIENIEELDDLVGVRLILLFKDDLERTKEIIRQNFEILSYEDTSTRLGDSQFGYQSDHFVVRVKPEWESIPTYKGLRNLKAELQVRTMAQHIWAAASHKLQYKQEENVPQLLKRSINRVSALLETVDLELNRLADERRNYRASVDDLSEDTDLDVDIAAKVLAELWPAKNLSPSEEDYDGLVSELRHFGVDSPKLLRELIDKHRKAEIDYEDEVMKSVRRRDNAPLVLKERVEKGFYFTQVALTRGALRREFGDDEVNSVITCGRASGRRLDKRTTAKPATNRVRRAGKPSGRRLGSKPAAKTPAAE